MVEWYMTGYYAFKSWTWQIAPFIKPVASETLQNGFHSILLEPLWPIKNPDELRSAAELIN